MVPTEAPDTVNASAGVGVVPQAELLRQAAVIRAATAGSQAKRPELGTLTAARRRKAMATPHADRRWDASALRLIAEFHFPLEGVPGEVRRGVPRGIAQALEFLEADPWCFRSGYMKADLMRALASAAELDGAVIARLQDVAVHRLQVPQPRLFWPTARLAERVWDPCFAGRTAALAAAGPPAAANASRLLKEMARRGHS